jgi:adenylate cyclase
MSETRKLAAILVADIVGYSRLARADEDRVLARLRTLRSDLIDPTIAVYHGRVVKRTGDGSIIEFRSVVDAVRCAVEVQNGMAERNAGLPEDRRIVFRVGIHLGDVVEEGDGDLMGDGVNIAARLEGIAEPGGICLSGAAYEQVRDRLKEGFVDLGERTLKNISRPVRSYALKTDSETLSPASFSPTRNKLDAPRLSIVVLPFANLGGDPEQEYFVDGVTESLTTDLSRISGSFVIARNTAYAYKGKAIDVKGVGRELGVRYVLEGSIQRGGSRMRVNAQLIDAESGNHIWAERFDKSLADLFEMQDEIVARLARQLDAALTTAEARRAERSPQPDSMDLYFQGRAWLNQGRTPENIARAREFMDKALGVDADNSKALAGAAMAYALEYTFGRRSLEVDYDLKILVQADRALLLDRDNILAYLAKSSYLNHSSRTNEASRVVDAGLVIDPNNALLYATRSNIETYLGQFGESKSDILQAMRLSPRDPAFSQWHNFLADAELGLGHFDAAIEECNKAIEGGYRVFYTYLNLAAAHGLKGRMEEARNALTEARRINPRLSVKWMIDHKPILLPAFEALRKAGMPKE